MKIQIYLVKKIGEPFKEFNYEDSNYKLTWEGTSIDLEINEILDDDEVLEIIFDRFNLDHRPKGYPDSERALSIGDVVSINYRTYLCETTGWKKLEKFNLVLKAF